MDKQAWIAYLKKIDEYGALAYPSDETAMVRHDFKPACQTLNKRFDLNLSSLISQDSSFYGYLTQNKGNEYTFAIRFSNFGRLFTIDGSPQSYVNSFPVDEIIKLLEDMKFVYVPMEILELPYEGPNRVVRMKNLNEYPRWWDRYFSYA